MFNQLDQKQILISLVKTKTVAYFDIVIISWDEYQAAFFFRRKDMPTLNILF